MKKILLYLIPFFLLISCASSRFESEFSPVYVTNTSKICYFAHHFNEWHGGFPSKDDGKFREG